jgi:hypothetical protein
MAAVEDDGLTRFVRSMSRVGREEFSYYIVPMFNRNSVQKRCESMVGDSVNLPRWIGAVVLRDDHLYLVGHVSGRPASRSFSFVAVSCIENQDRVVLLDTFVRLNFQERLDDVGALGILVSQEADM